MTPAAAPPGPFDSDAAWALLLAARRAPAAEPDGSRVLTSPACPGLQLVVDANGGWSCGIEATSAAAQLLDLYGPIVAGRGCAIGQLGQSLDGRIATQSGHSHHVTGSQDITRLHRLRALVDAVVVGSATVLADDPRLTVRAVDGPNPVRVIIDPGGRVPPDRTVLTDGAAATLHLVAPGSHPEPAASAGPDDGPGVERIPLPTTDGRLPPAAILDVLAARGLHRVLIEGGGITVSRFFAAGSLDRLHVTVAPIIIGSGRPSFTLPVVTSLDAVGRFPARRFLLGEDTLFDFDLRQTGLI